MKLIMDNSWTTIDYEGDNYLKDKVNEALRVGLGIKKDGYQYTQAYKRRVWDGVTIDGFFEADNNRFSTGLINQADDILGELQSHLNFQFEIIDDRPDELLSKEDLPEEIFLPKSGFTLRDYQYNSVKSIINTRNGIMHLSTNAGKSISAIGLVKLALDKLEHGETIGIFTESKGIFNQLHSEFEKHLDIKVGQVAGSKRDIQQVNIIMTPTVGAALSIDLEAKLSLTSKERLVKKVAKLAPQFLNGLNQKKLLETYIKNFVVKSKADTEFLEEITKLFDKSESDAKVKFHLNGYVVKYNNILKKKNEKKYNKKKDMQDLLDTVVLGVWDEAHHVSADSYYKSVMGCGNALIKLGLTGSIDQSDNYMVQRLKSAFHNISYRVTNKEMIDAGISAKPNILITPIDKVLDLDGSEISILNEKDYMTSYQKGIVDNTYRNALIAKMSEMWYTREKGVLLIVQRIEHGEYLKSLLLSMDVPAEFVHGGLPDEEREKHIQNMKDGTLKVLISSTIIDEGIDISGINVLIMTASGKSLRQTLQRIGRGLRKKEDDNTLTVIDFNDRTNRFLKDHSEARINIYKQEKFDIKFL